MSTRLKVYHGVAVLSLDYHSGDEFNLENRFVLQVLVGCFFAGIALGVFGGFPCTTWSNARRPRLRSKDHIYGFPELSPADASLAKQGNATLAATRGRVHKCIQLRIPVVLENPHSSLAWHEPLMTKLMQDSSCRVHVLDQCLFGAKWRKHTRLVSWNAVENTLLDNMCGRSSICSRTGLEHIRLRGYAGGGVSNAMLAQSYPSQLTAAIAKWLVNSVDTLHMEHLCQLAG